MIHHSLPLLVAFGAANLAAQDAGAPGFWRLPIHTLQVDNLQSAYGWWAAGDNYKVSFHDGFVFYPLLGPSYPENLPLRWTTARITAGGQPIADLAQRAHVHGDWRYEYRSAAVTEAYDVRADGVEQTFVIEARPRFPGDIVVEGRIATRLVGGSASPGASHQDILFTDAKGTPILRYGKAFAMDATGKKTPVSTHLEGDIVRLTVPAAWLQTARFPVTIDPLTSTLIIATGATAPLDPNIHREDESPQYNTMFVYSRSFSSGDFDCYGRLGLDDLSTSSIVFSDINAAYASLNPDVAYVAGADRWAIAVWVHDATSDRIWVYFHDKSNLVLNSGLGVVNADAPTLHHFLPSIGGTSHPTAGARALLVYRSDPIYGNTNTSTVRAAVLNASTRTFLANYSISNANQDAEAPDINCQIGWGDEGWVVVYHARDTVTDDYDIYLVGVQNNGLNNSTPYEIGPSSLGDKVRPVVQGWDGFYLVAMMQDVAPERDRRWFGRNIYVQRFDWKDFRIPPTMLPFRSVARSSLQDLTQVSLGFDGVSYSHWCLTHDSDVLTNARCNVKRLGMTGAVTEATQLDNGAAGRYHTAVTWNGVRREFPIIYCSIQSGLPLLGQRFQYPPNAWNLLYGNSCGPGTIRANLTPLAGTRFYQVILENAPPGQPAVLWLSIGSGSQDLSVFGAANCFLNLASVLISFPGATNAAGQAVLGLSLFDDPLILGDLYWQFLYLWPAAPTPLRVGLTRGMRSHIE